MTEGRREVRDILTHEVEDALLASDPGLILDAEETIEEILRDHLGRQRALESGPRHVALHVFAVGLLRDADLERTESRFGADFRGENLVERGAACAAPSERGAGHEATDGVHVAVALS